MGNRPAGAQGRGASHLTWGCLKGVDFSGPDFDEGGGLRTGWVERFGGRRAPFEKAAAAFAATAFLDTRARMAPQPPLPPPPPPLLPRPRPLLLPSSSLESSSPSSSLLLSQAPPLPLSHRCPRAFCALREVSTTSSSSCFRSTVFTKTLRLASSSSSSRLLALPPSTLGGDPLLCAAACPGLLIRSHDCAPLVARIFLA
mmetsp:Transcript_30024/g.54475  ORF Transcript_30024/g.54475 Transcript_30024/m.54475 type:complete len:200 (-) Transcript_30024:1161-1760(-)